MTNTDLVFISYAREDQSWAERLYMDLRKHQVDAWLDVRCLKPGANWKLEIRKAIRQSRQFILMLSRHSINKRGFVQREIREGIEALQQVPKGEIFLIPTRLDQTEPIDEELHELNWVDLLPDYPNGLSRLLSVLAENRTAPLTVAGGSSAPTVHVQFFDRGREATLAVPLVIGERAAISYAPFRSAKEFVQQFIDRLPTDRIFADPNFSYYFTVETTHPKVLLGDDLRAQYPEFITLVLQRAFNDLQIREDGFSVVLAFNKIDRTVAIPYEAIRAIDMPHIGVSIRIDPPELPKSIVGTSAPPNQDGP